jgi:hypothetical protein
MSEKLNFIIYIVALMSFEKGNIKLISLHTPQSHRRKGLRALPYRKAKGVRM